MYLVSILVPVYGVEKYIERCARSLFEQTYQNLEFVFVDDCSRDKSIELLSTIINDYPDRKCQLRIIRHEKNRGLAAVRNTAVQEAKGDFVCHVDSDDYIEPDTIKMMVDVQMKNHSDIVSVGAYQHLRDKVMLIRQFDSDNKELQLLSILQCIVNHTIWGRLIRLSLYKDYGIMNKEGYNMGEDSMTTPRLVYYAESVSSISTPLYHYNFSRDDSMCAQYFMDNSPTSWEEDITNYESVVDFFDDKEDVYKDASREMVISVMEEYLRMCAYYGHKQLFDKIKQSILGKYDQYLSVIGWDHFVKRNMMGNYIVCRLYQRYPSIRRLYGFLINK